MRTILVQINIIFFVSNLIYTQSEQNDINLHVGANLISFYVLPEDNSVESIFDSIEDQITSVATSGSAAIYQNGYWIGSLLEIEPEKGYWVMVDSPVTLTLYGDPINPFHEYDLSYGSNLISYPFDHSININEAFSLNTIWSINGILGEGIAALNLNGQFVGSLSEFDKNHGYWFLINSPTTLTYNDFAYENCELYTHLAENELENILFDFYNNPEFTDCFSTFDDNPNCISELINFDEILFYYNQVLDSCPDSPAGNFGYTIITLMSIINDTELNDLLFRWHQYFNSNTSEESTVSTTPSAIPLSINSLNQLQSLSDPSTISSQFQNPLLFSTLLGRDNRDIPYLNELQTLIENVFIPRVNMAIDRIDNVIDRDYNFIITGEMLGDIYQSNIEMDDTEFLIIKGLLHYLKSGFLMVTTYDISNIGLDFSDYYWANKDQPFLTMRSGRELNFQNAYLELLNVHESLSSSILFLENEIDWQDNDFIQNNLTDEEFQKLEDELYKIEDMLEDTYDYKWEICDNWVCSGEHNNYWENYDCECKGQSLNKEVVINIEDFMNNPPNDLKEFIPNYSIETGECELESENSNSLFFEVYNGNGIYGVTLELDGEPFYWSQHGYWSRKFKSITLDTYYGELTYYRPNNYASTPPPYPPSNTTNTDRTHLNWHLVDQYGGNFYITAWDGYNSLYFNLYSSSSWDMITSHDFYDHHFDYNGQLGYIYSTCCGVSSNNTGVNVGPCPLLTWNADTYSQWIGDWEGTNLTSTISAGMGVDSIRMTFRDDPYYNSSFGYYMREVMEVAIYTDYGEVLLSNPYTNRENPQSESIAFNQQVDHYPHWGNNELLRTPIVWNLVEIGNGIYYFVGNQGNQELYLLLNGENNWDLASSNVFIDHWIDLKSNYGQLFSFNGLYPQMTIEDILAAYKVLFDIDQSTWVKTIGDY